MSRVGCCVALYLLVLAHAPAAFCLELPQHEIDGHHFNQEQNFGGLPNEHRKGVQYPERFQGGFENPGTFNKPQFEKPHGLRNTEGLNNFEHQPIGQINQPQFDQGINQPQLGQNERDKGDQIEFNGLEKSGNIRNPVNQFGHEDQGQLSERGLPGVQRFKRFEQNEKGLLQPSELVGLENSQGNIEHGQRGLLEGFKSERPQDNSERNAEGPLQSHVLRGIKKPQELLNFEREEQARGRLQELKPETIINYNLGLGNEAKEGKISELSGLENVQGSPNFELGNQQSGLLQRHKSTSLPGFQQARLNDGSKQEGLLPSVGLNGLQKSKQGHNFEIGQQQSGLLQDIQSQGHQQYDINSFGIQNNKEGLLQDNQKNRFNNVQGLHNLEFGGQGNGLLEKLNANKLKLNQNFNLQQGQESHSVLQPNEFDIIKNVNNQQNIQLGEQQGNLFEGSGLNGVWQIQEKELQNKKKEQQLLSQNLNGQLNRQVFTQPIQTNHQNFQELNRFTQPPGFQQTFPYNQPPLPYYSYFNGNQPDQATVQKMIEEARIQAENLQRTNLNVRKPLPLPAAPFSPYSFKLARPNIESNNAESFTMDIRPSNNEESFTVNVQPVSQGYVQPVIKFKQKNSQELENADKIFLDDLARRGFRINEVTQKLQKIPGVAQISPLPIIQTAPIGPPEVIQAISSAEEARKNAVSQVAATTRVTANEDSPSQLNLPAVPTILNIADSSSTLDQPGQVSINVGIPSIEQISGPVISPSTQASSQSPSSGVSVAISKSASSGSHSGQGNINEISSTTSPSIDNFPGLTLSGSTYNNAGRPSSSVSVNNINTFGSNIAAPKLVDLPGQGIISSTSPSTDSSVSVRTISSSTGGQSSPASIAIDINTSPTSTGGEIIRTISPLVNNPVSASASTSSEGGQAGQVAINGITTASSSKYDQSGTVPIALGSNTLPSSEDLPGQVIKDAVSSSEGSPSSINAVSVSASSSGGNIKPNTNNGITTASSSKYDQSGTVPIALGSNTLPSSEDLPGQVIKDTVSSSEGSPSSINAVSVSASSSGGNIKPNTNNGITTASSSKYDQSGTVPIALGSNTLPSSEDLPGQVIKDTVSSSEGSPSSINAVSVSASSSGGNIKPNTNNGITTASSSKYDQSGTVPIALGSNTLPSSEDLPGQVIKDAVSSSEGSPSSINAVSVSASSSGGNIKPNRNNGITTVSSSKYDQSGTVPIALGSNTLPSSEELPGQVIKDTVSSSEGSPSSINAVSVSASSSGGNIKPNRNNGITTVSSSKYDQSGTVPIALGSNTLPSSEDLPGQVIKDTVSSSEGSPSSINAVSVSASSSGGNIKASTNNGITSSSTEDQSELIDFILASSDSTASSKDSPGQFIINSATSPAGRPISVNELSTSSSSNDGQLGPTSSSIGDQKSQVTINGGTLTSKEEQSGPVAVTVGSGGPSDQVTIEPTSSSTGSPASVSSIRTSYAAAGEKVNLPSRKRITISPIALPTKHDLGNLRNAGQITINSASTSTPGSESVTINTSSNSTPIIDNQHAEITSANIHHLPSLETWKESELSDLQQSLQNILINKQHSTVSKSPNVRTASPERIFKRLGEATNKNHIMYQPITTPKNYNKLFKMILNFNSTLGKYQNPLEDKTPGISSKHKPIIELPWDKENQGPTKFIPKYVNEEWQSKTTNEVDELSKIHPDSRYRQINSLPNQPKKKDFIIDGTELIPVEETTNIPGSSVHNHFDWTGTKHANSCHGDCNAEPACGYTCGRTCADYKEPSRFCNKHEKCNVGACQCKNGFVLDINTNRCVHPDQCSQCGPNEYLEECPDLCLPEECPSGRPPKACRPTDDCRKPMCRCIMNHRRNNDDICIPIQQCPTLKCYGKNEVYSPCTREDLDEYCESSLPQCFTSKTQNQSPAMCIARCTCGAGHLRNDNNECVPIDQCSRRSREDIDYEQDDLVDEMIKEEENGN